MASSLAPELEQALAEIERLRQENAEAPVLKRMHDRRLKTYKALGFEVA